MRLVRKWLFTAAIIEVRTRTNFRLKSAMYYSFNKLKVAVAGKLQRYNGNKTFWYVLLLVKINKFQCGNSNSDHTISCVLSLAYYTAIMFLTTVVFLCLQVQNSTLHILVQLIKRTKANYLIPPSRHQ